MDISFHIQLLHFSLIYLELGNVFSSLFIQRISHCMLTLKPPSPLQNAYTDTVTDVVLCEDRRGSLWSQSFIHFHPPSTFVTSAHTNTFVRAHTAPTIPEIGTGVRCGVWVGGGGWKRSGQRRRRRKKNRNGFMQIKENCFQQWLILVPISISAS